MLFSRKSDKSKSKAAEPEKKPTSGLDADSTMGGDSVLGGDSVALPADVVQETVRAPIAGRPKVISITIKDRKTLHAAYMPFLKSGGIFVPSSGSYEMGDEIFMLLKLIDAKDNISVPGKVVWVTPEGAMSNRVAGIGIEFSGSEAGQARSRIEGILGGALKSRRMTHTM